MASNIVPGNVDNTYPTAGQDNSSQGFRDNFSATKNNFTEAVTEIVDLQTNKARKNQTKKQSNLSAGSARVVPPLPPTPRSFLPGRGWYLLVEELRLLSGYFTVVIPAGEGGVTPRRGATPLRKNEKNTKERRKNK